MSVSFPGGVPQGLKWEDRGHELRVTWRWRHRSTWGLVGFAVFWNLFMLPFMFGGFRFGLSFHLLAGIAVAVMALRQVLNRTEVVAAPGRLTARSGPIRIRVHDVDINPHELKQLFVRSREAGKVNGRPVVYYEVHAITGTHHADVRLVGNLPELAQAHFIEREFERYLEIQNQRTGRVGEIPQPTFLPPPRPQDTV